MFQLIDLIHVLLYGANIPTIPVEAEWCKARKPESSCFWHSKQNGNDDATSVGGSVALLRRAFAASRHLSPALCLHMQLPTAIEGLVRTGERNIHFGKI